MSTIRLLTLGAVRRRGRAHGYQVRADLESWGAHEWSTARSGSVYHALGILARDGLLLAHDVAPSEAGGPPRVEYELTPDGDSTYLELLRGALASRDPRLDQLSAAVGLIDDLPREEAVTLLRRRVEALDAWHATIADAAPADLEAQEWGPIGAVLGLWLHEAASRADWTRRLLERLEAGAFTMADER
ncbi:transcriptional regulator, PadR-like family [Beutenbergia cavernae DSM 12333]|uniref:Transcriptional regulator, PadR-like family n=1 Tax=Beutenbergia cavernae (strain ATCC BAA-8 / DSM 12333 / CCUG 43141 / JCM 11478 / NBRC 16432 / NCIMB 13614 / HKI 0122) TaxID=471853 RepID=C5BZV9_BEUC1|nr:helix-turn-helix transcriptional regulator [Beutenbergia cavernae]ACQ81289.1 transcriptional regulator, PadR-like family [Beutenbergia cavernae DSM 12333]